MRAHGWLLVLSFASSGVAERSIAQAPTASVPPSSSGDCTRYALEGIPLSIPIGEAFGAIPSGKWRRIGRPKDGRQGHVIVRRGDDLAPRRYVNVIETAGRVEVVSVDYTCPPMSLRRIDPEGLQRLLLERFGAPTSRGFSGDPNLGVRRLLWIDDDCDRVVALDWELPGMEQAIRLTLARASTWEEPRDASAGDYAAKVWAARVWSFSEVPSEVPTLAAESARSPDAEQPAADCSRYFLEGVSLDMTRADARIATPGSQWDLYRVPTDGRPTYELAIAKDARLPRRKLFVTISNETVDALVVDYARDHSITIGPGVVDRAALEQSFIARFGTPTWRGQQAALSFTLDRITWIDVRCNQVVELALGEWDWGPNFRTPLVSASLERASSWQAKRELTDAIKWRP